MKQSTGEENDISQSQSEGSSCSPKTHRTLTDLVQLQHIQSQLQSI
jgi:hypothetical protein